MSARRIVALPVDGRPVVRAQVQSLVASAGWELAMPAVAALGHLRRRDLPRTAVLALGGLTGSYAVIGALRLPGLRRVVRGQTSLARRAPA